ncbi:hypothetical protein P3T43_004654 [Paraburkholderia sp. GAS41]|jgi:hypothetical protein
MSRKVQVQADLHLLARIRYGSSSNGFLLVFYQCMPAPIDAPNSPRESLVPCTL